MSDIMKKYGLLIPNINPYDETFAELLPQIIWNFHDTNKTWKERSNPSSENPYLLLKQELETLLTERNLDEIEEVMVKSENRGPYGSDQETRCELAACHAKFFERIYFEVYKDDTEYKPELVQTPIEELLKMHF